MTVQLCQIVGYSACRSDNQLHWPTQWCSEVICDYMLSWELEKVLVCCTFCYNRHCELYCLLCGFKITPDVCIFVLEQLFGFMEYLYHLVDPDGLHWKVVRFGYKAISHMHKQHVMELKF